MPYLTLRAPARAEIEVKKSRFLGFCTPLQSPEAFAPLLAQAKKLHPAARHHAWAYLLREGNAPRYSDDGEPQGTAGLPILETLRGAGLTDCAVIVTRYFGGTLLGTGGLSRAYAQAAREALAAAPRVTMTPCQVLRLRCAYALYGRVEPLIAACGGVLLESAFAAEVTLTLRVPAQACGEFLLRVREAANGRAACETLREEMGELPD